MSTDKHSEEHSWPEWQLTAFVLDELKPDIAAKIQSSADSDPSLAAEIAAIRATVAQVTHLYKHETVGIEPTAFVSLAPTSDSAELATSGNDPAVFRRTTDVKVNWTAAIGLVAMAASLLIAFFFAAPALQNYFSQSNDVLAKADDAQRIATSEAKVRELTRTLEETKTELSSMEAMRRSSVEGVKPNDEQVRSLTESDTDLMSETKYAEAEVDAEQVIQIVPTESMTQVAVGNATTSPSATESIALGIVDDVQQAPLPSQTLNKSLSISQGMGGMGGSMSLERGSRAKGRMASEGMPTSGMGGMMGGLDVGNGGMGGMGMGGMDGMGNGAMVEGKSVAALADGDIASEYSTSGGQENRMYDRRFSSTTENRRQPFSRESSSDRYAPIYENPFKSVESDPLTTFSIDVDTASYVKTRQFLMQSHSLPPVNAVRVEEFINYFEYEYAGPQGDDPFAANLAVATCPWRSDHKLVRIALQAKKVDISERPKANIVFLLDVSGSMDEPNKLPLVKESMRMLIQQLGENDRVAMVVYAGAAGCVLESTTGDKQDKILGALDRLNAGGSTNGGQGIQLAYDIARDHFVPGGVNRVILCTDGDFNVGTTSTEGLVNLVAQNAKSKVFLTVLGFGMGNTNDVMMEQISDKGNGVYGFVDSRREAERQMVKQLTGNLMTVAKDVKIQVEFNPERVASYRLIGYENRKLANEDFANDKKDAGEIGAGHRVTALYEIEPIGASKVQSVEGLRYQKRKPEVTAEQPAKSNDESNNELLAVSLRYKQPEGDTSKLLTFPLVDSNKPFAEVDQDFKWAASVAQFAMLLRNSTYKGNTSWSGLLETAESLATDESRRECVNMIRKAAGLSRR